MNSEAAPQIDGLRFDRELGAGGYADVYLYDQDQPRRKVAVKVLRETGLSERTVRSFTAEANAMAQLEHPHIVPVYATGTTRDHRPYIVMMYYPRASLAERARSERLTVPEVLRLGIQLGSAIETAHRAGLLHRDIKPANVLTSAYGKPGLADFGIAGQMTDEDDADSALSVPWSPPETLYGTAPASVRSDVYSLAATLWHVLVGRSPFEVPNGDNTPFELMRRIRDVPPLSTGRGDVPASLDRLLRTTMSKSPGLRPASAREFIGSLQAIEQELRLPKTEIELAQDFTSIPIRPANDSPDATRAKGVQRISAQAPSLPSVPVTNVDSAETRRRAEPLTGADAPTRLRPASVGEQPQPEPAPRKRIGGLIAAIASVLIVSIIVGVGVAVAMTGKKTTARPSATSSIGEQAPQLGDGVPPGIPDVKSTRSGGKATFTWTYSAAKKDDQIRWRVPGTSTSNVAKESQIVVEAKGEAKVCIEMQISRFDGSYTQADWTKACG